MRASSTARLPAAAGPTAAVVAAALGRAAAAAMALRRPARWTAAVGSLALGHAVHRPRLLHLLARANGIALLQQPGECRPGTFGNLALQLLWQIRKGDVGMDRLDIAEKLVGQPARRSLQRGDRIDDRREDDRLHDIIGGFLHSI